MNGLLGCLVVFLVKPADTLEQRTLDRQYLCFVRKTEEVQECKPVIFVLVRRGPVNGMNSGLEVAIGKHGESVSNLQDKQK